MEGVRQYLLSVTAAALFCSVIISILGDKSAYASIVKMISGVVISLVALSPLVNLDMTSLWDTDLPFYQEGRRIAEDGARESQNALSAIIKERTESYILDKAAAYHLQIEVQAELSDGDPPVPNQVTIIGAVSPYVKRRLQEVIANDLGIPKENQKWT